MSSAGQVYTRQFKMLLFCATVCVPEAATVVPEPRATRSQPRRLGDVPVVSRLERILPPAPAAAPAEPAQVTSAWDHSQVRPAPVRSRGAAGAAPARGDPGSGGSSAGAAGPGRACGRRAVAMALQTQRGRRPARPRAPSGRTVPKEIPEKQKSKDSCSQNETKHSQNVTFCLGSRM